MRASISGTFYAEKGDGVQFDPGIGGCTDDVEVLTNDLNFEFRLFMRREQSVELLRSLVIALPGDAEEAIVEAGVSREYLKERIAEEVS